MTTLPEALSLAEIEGLDPGSGSGTERRYLCPACGPEHRQDAAHRSLAVNIASGAYVCHRCGAAGLLAEHQTQRPNPSFTGRAVSRPPLPAPASHHQRPKPEPASASGPCPWAHLHLGSIAGTDAERYLASRGLPTPLPPGTDVRWCASFGPAGKPGRPAVVFALRDASGAAVAVQGRFTDDHAPKCQSLGPVSQGLFATPRALDTAMLVVTEAPLDALAMAAAGVPALATCGTRASWPDWLELAGRTVVLAQDADEAGDRQAATLGHAAAKAGANVFRLRPPCKDWAQSIEQRGWLALREVLVAAVGTGEPPQMAQEPPGPTSAPAVVAKAHNATGDASPAPAPATVPPVAPTSDERAHRLSDSDLCRVCGAASGHDHWHQGWICRRCWPRVAASTISETDDGVGTEAAGSGEVPASATPSADERAHGLSDADRASLVDAGLILGRCDACGQEDTLPRSKPTRPCRMTAKCQGTVRQ